MNHHVWFRVAYAAAAALLALFMWMADKEIKANASQNQIQWQKIQALTERMSHLEGWKDAEKFYGCKVKETK